MKIEIIKPGVLTTIQDLGRPQHRAKAIPVSGAMDTLAARLANKALGNLDNAATIEFTYGEASFVTLNDILISYSGKGAWLMDAQRFLPPDRPLFIPAGKTLTFKTNPAGARTYLAIAGGWDAPIVLDSRSTFLTGKFGGLEGRILKAGDQIVACETLEKLTQKLLDRLRSEQINYPRWSIASRLFNNDTYQIRIIKGQEYEWFENSSIADLLNQTFQMTMQSNRMGLQLQGPAMKRRRTGELLSTAVTFGTIQVTGNGNLMILMADGQTTGGYPRIGQVAAIDLPLCAQLKPNDTVNFIQIDARSAERLFLQRERELAVINTSLNYRFNYEKN